jgi:hypothetical protein
VRRAIERWRAGQFCSEVSLGRAAIEEPRTGCATGGAPFSAPRLDARTLHARSEGRRIGLRLRHVEIRLDIAGGTIMQRLVITAIVTLAAALGGPARADVLIGMAGPITGKNAWFGEQMERHDEAVKVPRRLQRVLSQPAAPRRAGP